MTRKHPHHAGRTTIEEAGVSLTRTAEIALSAVLEADAEDRRLPPTVGEVCEKAANEHGYPRDRETVQKVESLEEKGLVETSSDPLDPAQKRVEPTAAGRELEGSIFSSMTERAGDED